MWTELINAAAKVLDAVAWPIVAVVAVVVFRKELRELLGRLRKGGGIEFDPPRQLEGQGSSAATTATALATVNSLRNPTVIEWEGFLRDAPPLAQLQEGQRETALLTMAARAVVFWLFEQLDGAIWASQLQILAHLNGRDEALPVLKSAFFEPAAAANPDWFTNYSFDHYIGFLVGQGLISIANERAAITSKGRDFLAWRVDQRKPLKTLG